MPALQTSPTVQVLLSLQGLPLLVGCAMQEPLSGLQTPRLQALLRPLQSTGLPPPQVPALQTSLVVQLSPSLQLLPLLIATASQVFCALQPPVVHCELNEAQSASIRQSAGAQAPAWQNCERQSPLPAQP